MKKSVEFGGLSPDPLQPGRKMNPRTRYEHSGGFVWRMNRVHTVSGFAGTLALVYIVPKSGKIFKNFCVPHLRAQGREIWQTSRSRQDPYMMRKLGPQCLGGWRFWGPKIFFRPLPSQNLTRKKSQFRHMLVRAPTPSHRQNFREI